MKNVYGYTRVSTAKQGEGVSLDEQKSSIENYAKKHNLNIIEWFEEKETAAKSGRPVFTKVVSNLRRKKADGLVIHKIDRSARNLRDWASVGELIDDGIDVHFSYEAIDFSTRGGRLSADIQAVVSADYVRNLRQETIKGFYGRLKQGILPLQAPLGYVNQGSGNVKTICPVKGTLVKELFILYATGNYNVRSLAKKMNNMGLTSRKGKPLTKNAISGILTNPFYYGLIRIRKTGETFQGKHEPLISKQLYNKTADIRNGKLVRKKVVHSFAFSRTIKCVHCKYSLIGEIQKGHTYYRCHTKGCPTSSVREESITIQLKIILKRLSLSNRHIRSIEDKFDQLEQSTNTQTVDLEQTLKMQILSLQNRVSALTDALLDNLINQDEYKDKKQNISEQLEELKRKLHLSETGNTGFTQNLTDFLELLKSLNLLSQKSKPEEIKELTFSITSNLYVDRKKLVFEPFSIYSVLLKLNAVPLGGLRKGEPSKKGGTIHQERRISNFRPDKLIYVDDLVDLKPIKFNKKNKEKIIRKINDYCLTQ